MALTPTTQFIESFRSDLEKYLSDGYTVDNRASTALEQFKMDIKDKRQISFNMLLNDEADGYVGEFSDRIMWMVAHLTISLIFRDYAILQGVSSWWDLANEYEARYQNRLEGTDFSSLTYSRPQMSFVTERA